MNVSRYWATAFFLVLVCSPVYAGTGGNAAFISAPIQQLSDLVSGDVGRAVSALIVAGLGFQYVKDRNEDKGSKAIVTMVAVLLIVAPLNAMSAFGIQGAGF